MDIEPGLRREPPTDIDAVGEDPELADRIREEIRRDGPMPFARFMAIILYDRDAGYYTGADPRPGRAGDFITAPELHPIFGATLSGLLLETWHRLGKPDRFVVREIGAGTGALAVAMLEALRGSPLATRVRYQPVEMSEHRIAGIRDRLAQAGLAMMADDTAPTGLAGLAAMAAMADDTAPTGAAEPIDGVIVANEVLDALPVHRVRRRGPSLREIAVDLTPTGSFVEVEVEPTDGLAARLVAEGIDLVDGQTAEICLELDRWVADEAAGLRRGLLLLIDYGAPATDLYDPARRPDGTLRAYVRHQVHDDPYRHVGRQDLTAHVDVTAVERAAHRAGLTTVGITTQAEALVGLGIEERLRAIQADPATSLDEYLVVRSALMRMLDPAAMGRFRVMGFGRAWPDGPVPSAFAFRQPDRRRPPRSAPD